MRRRFVVLVGLSMGVARVAGAEPPIDVLVLPFESPKLAEEAEAPWVPARLAALLVDRLRLLGFDMWDSRAFEGRASADSAVEMMPSALIFGTLSTSNAGGPELPISISANLKTTARTLALAPFRGRVGELDRLASELAFAIAEALGAPPRPLARARILELGNPFDVHRALGIATAQLAAGSFRKALVAYDRARALVGQGILFEALLGRARAEAELVGRGEATFGARADLAPSAAVRAELAEKRGDGREAARALEAYWLAIPDHALRWTLERPLHSGTFSLLAESGAWVLQHGSVGARRVMLDSRTGAKLRDAPVLPGLAAFSGSDAIVLDRNVLTRMDEKDRPRWRLELPLSLRGANLGGVLVTAGVVGLIADREVAWVDATFGGLGQRATSVRPLAAGDAGVLVEVEENELALLRPGKRAPAWRVMLGPVVAAALVGDRAVLLLRATAGVELALARALDGREVGPRLSLPEDARILGAEGRYATVAVGARGARIIDLVSGEAFAVIDGPARPIAALSLSAGVAILYATGDLLFFERDGVPLDRARVPGVPFDLRAGSPLAPGPVAVTSRGLFAFAERGTRAQPSSDVTALLALARAAVRLEDRKTALELVERISVLSASQIEAAESLRAELAARRDDELGRAMARAATMRAERTRTPSTPVGPFVLLE